MAYSEKGLSLLVNTKVAGVYLYSTVDALATVEGAGYFNPLAINSKIAPTGLIIHIDTNLSLVTLYGYSHDGAVVTLDAAKKEVME